MQRHRFVQSPAVRIFLQPYAHQRIILPRVEMVQPGILLPLLPGEGVVVVRVSEVAGVGGAVVLVQGHPIVPVAVGMGGLAVVLGQGAHAAQPVVVEVVGGALRALLALELVHLQDAAQAAVVVDVLRAGFDVLGNGVQPIVDVLDPLLSASSISPAAADQRQVNLPIQIQTADVAVAMRWR